ncbi:MAG: hypothetical protein NZ740_08060 [Kiritimatiellae bacterium]|nr:hypothetical protein [Kiritimatiellia bacterium]MDW8459047.1 hypothetical protein [Verrucomicrobiota bacterium]
MMSQPQRVEDDVYAFDDPRRAVVIRRPDLPAPWINYLSNGNLHAFVSHAGGGCLWWKSPINFRITRYRSWMSPVDSPGFYLYVRESAGTVWSPTWMPTKTPLDEWRAEHTPGSSRFFGRRGDLAVGLSLFIAPEEDILVWDAQLSNLGSRDASVDLFAYVEFGLLEWLQEYQWGYYIRNMLKTRWDDAAAAQLYLYHHQSHPRLADLPLVFFASNRAVAGSAGDRQAFLGPYRSERDPLAVELGRCGGEQIWCGDPCGALHVPVRVAPGASERVSFFLGLVPRAMGDYSAALRALPEILSRAREPGWIDAQRRHLDGWWADHFSAFDCRLPDPDIERQIRTWSPVNCVHTGRYSRSFSQAASGLRGYGFRDTAQDMLAIAYRRPDWAREEFFRLLRHQFADGHVVHTYFPEDKQAPWRTVHSDDHLWLPMLAYALVSETGDLGLLDEKVPYLAENGLDRGPEATVWAHLLAALDFTAGHLGAHGIPLTLHSDWNDCIGRFARKGRGESVFAAMQYVYVLRQMLELARARGESDTERRLSSALDGQLHAISTRCWDGEWWIRAFDDDGAPVGSRTCRYGKIWLNSQSWSVLANVGDRDRQIRAMDAVYQILNTERGIKKLHPSFPTYPEDMDAFVGYSLGCGENGAIFCHANTWAIIAEALLGRAERAWQYFRQLVPHLALRRAGLDRYQAEPYAWASSIIGPENPRFGWANIPHVTGTAAWMDIAATQYLLGIRPELGGLRIEPVLPAEWAGFSCTRKFRGCRVEIEARRAHAGEEPGITVNGERLAGPLVPATSFRRPSAQIAVILPQTGL